MKKIYIDVTSMVSVDFITGIQRVVRSVLLEMEKMIPERLVLLAYSMDKKGFVKINNSAFFDFYRKKIQYKSNILTDQKLNISDMNEGDIFFDIDSVWNSPYKRSVLLPELKKRGIKIAVYIYDIIPVTNPEFCYGETTFQFLNYLGAFLQYADVLIASAQSTLDEVYKLMDELGLKHIPGYYSWLGSEFQGVKDFNIDSIPQNVKDAADSKYILCVGTIEPRKNHKFLLDAFEKVLFKKGVNLIFAGKLGWNVEELSQRIKDSKFYNKQLFHFTGLDDAAIEYLYQKALMLAFPTYNEGFGLPMVEALERGTPVIASDIPILREVGKDYCEYFGLNNLDEFCEKVVMYLEDKDSYQNLKEKIAGYTSFTWEETTERIIKALDTI